jgi:hypothetical protein
VATVETEERQVMSDTATPSIVDRSPRWFWYFFPALVVLFIARNHHLFTKTIYEEGDAAANSILVENAKHFTQLVGNYSRIGFNHPGPAFLYVQAFGEWLFYDRLGVVPSPYNGQALAILTMNAALIALAASIIVRWLAPAGKQVWVATAVAGAGLVFLGSWTDMATSTWPPFEYFAPYVLLLAAGASVAAGALRDLWALVLAAGLLVHGHAEFLFLASSLAAVGLGAPLWRHRKALPAYLRDNRANLIGALAVLVVLAVPIVVNLVLHWPGEFSKYLSYGGKHSANPLTHSMWYVTRLWDISPYLAGPVLLCTFAAVALAVRVSGHPYVRWGAAFSGLGVATILLYTILGIDSLGEYYILFFTRALPLYLLLLTTAAAIRWARFGARVATVLFATGGLVLGLISPAMVNRQVSVSDVPAALEALAARTPAGRPVVVRLATPEAWAEAVPLALSGHRRGMRICFVNESVRLMSTAAYLCRADEARSGLPVVVARKPGIPADGRLLSPLNRSRVWIVPYV